MITQKQQIVNYWIENLYPKHGMHEWDMGCDFSEATSQVIPSLCLKAIKSSKSKSRFELWGDGNQPWK